MLVGLVSGLYLEQSVEHSVPREQPLRAGCLEHGATQPFILFDCHSAISQPLEWQRGEKAGQSDAVSSFYRTSSKRVLGRWRLVCCLLTTSK